MASGSNVITVDSVVTTTEELDKIVITVAEKDLVRMLRLVGAQAIDEEIRAGNPVTNIIVDNRGNKPIDTAERRIQAFFGPDRSRIRKAVFEAWARIQALTRRDSGRAQLSYELWFNDRPIGATPAAVDLTIERMSQRDHFSIVGPVLIYGRRIYWNPVGKPRFSRRVKLRTGSATFKTVRVVGIMKRVETELRRNYRDVAIAESWVKTTALPKDGRTPALWIGPKKRGAVKTNG